MTTYLKNRSRKGFGLDMELTKRLEAYSKETFIPESRIVDMALKMFFEDVDKKRKNK